MMLAELARRGLGVAILPEFVAASRPNDLHMLIIRQPAVRARVELAWRRDAPLAPAARIFIDHAKAVLSPRVQR